MKLLWQAADFIRGIGRDLRFGELSRAQLALLRLEIRRDEAECEWIARDADMWDASLERIDRDHNFSEQALRDAIAVRELLFVSLPKVNRAALRVFRTGRSLSGSAAEAREPPDLIIAGVVSREDAPAFRVGSLVMRAKLYGLGFRMEEGVLQALTEQKRFAGQISTVATYGFS